MMKLFSLGLVVALAACGGSEADELGVGAQCASNDDCNPDIGPTCLTQFKGGYCGLTGCQLDADCPEDSACVTHDDGVNYCFRLCGDKPECNANRDPDNEANCSGTADFVEGSKDRKACVPPSSGT